MSLTDKCKEDFEEWYKSLEDFYHLDLMPNNMVYGLYVDWFDSVGIHLNDDTWLNRDENKTEYFFEVMNNKGQYDSLHDETGKKTDFSTRKESREQAIVKANDIYNSI